MNTDKPDKKLRSPQIRAEYMLRVKRTTERPGPSPSSNPCTAFGGMQMRAEDVLINIPKASIIMPAINYIVSCKYHNGCVRYYKCNNAIHISVCMQRGMHIQSYLFNVQCGHY